MTAKPAHDTLISLLRSHSPELRESELEPEPHDELTVLGIDSLELLSLAADMEDAFDLDIDDADVGSAKTVADLLRIIEPALRKPAE
ncbi:acyl carrier protein [Streptomyces shenzhenensis]|uniref:acyl carrier protein n=1 Tax=Streptomyces shenzhenensis TaxID=943815 RepID=UPI0015F0BAA9|nr:acyl carrier protein [Streptomyces shenzhenensis]